MATNPTKTPTPATNIPQAAFKVMLGGFLSLAMGLGSQMVMASLFGAGPETDAFFTALIVPLYLQLMLMNGVPFVVIPAFVHEQTNGREEEAWSLAGTIFWLTLILLVGMAVVGAFGSYTIVTHLTPGFAEDKSRLAAQMLSILMFTAPFIGISYLTSGVENIRNRWFWPAAATAVGSAGNLVTLFIVHPMAGPMTLAWGNLVSAVLQASITTIPFLRHGWKKRIPLRDPRMREMGRLITPFIILGVFTCSKLVLERYFASSLPDGQIAYLGYAVKIANIFVVLLAGSIASAIFPAMARSFSQSGLEELKNQTEYGLKLTMASALPSVAVVSILAVPLITVIYEHGSFGHEDTLNVAIIIPVVMLYDVLFRMIINLINRAFYILKETLLVNVVESVMIPFYILAAHYLTPRWGYFGLALAQPIQAGLVIILLGVLLLRRFRSLFIRKMGKYSIVYIFASLIAALAGWVVLRLSMPFPAVIQLAFGLVSAGLSYLTLLYWLDREMTLTLLKLVGITRFHNFIKLKYDYLRS